MIRENDMACPLCNGPLKYYDSVSRIIRLAERKTKYIKMRRFKCAECGHVHRELPKFVLPYKQYRKEIVFGVISNKITYETLGYEDYPCEMTMDRWKAHDLLDI